MSNSICHVNFFIAELIFQIFSFVRLRKLELVIAHTLTRKSIHSIVTLQPDLQDITICVDIETRFNGWAKWIEKCARLVRLKIGTNDADELVVDGTLLNVLASRSHLRELVLETNAIPVITSDFRNNRKTLDHLRRLQLSLPNIDYDCVLGKISSNLNYLKLKDKGGISSETLKFISNRFVSIHLLFFDFGICVQIDELYSGFRLISSHWM